MPDLSPEIVVPIQRDLPTLQAGANWVADMASYLLTRLLDHESAMLHADFRATGEQWFLQYWTTTVPPVENQIAAPDHRERGQGIFRAILAHFGGKYMSGQLYGGYSQLSLRQGEKRRHVVIYMANDSWRGYWIRIFARQDPDLSILSIR